MTACPTCGHQNADHAAFCSQCGAKLSAKDAPRAATVYLQPAASPARLHRLVVVRPGGSDGASFNLQPGRWACGRADAPLRLEDPYLSPKHAEFVLKDDELGVIDLNSANGVFMRLRGEMPLIPSDELRLGRQLLRLEALAQPEFTPDGGRVWGSPSRGYRFRLVQLLEGSGSGEAMPLGDGEYLLGREEGGMTFPADPSVSRRHAILKVAGEVAVLKDLDSANGTFLRLRKETALHHGDQLLLGTQQLRYEVR